MKRYVWKVFFDHEKEEVWLNGMSAKGLAFTDFFLFRYSFLDCEPGEYIYRIELLETLPDHPEGMKYICFMAENRVEHVSSWFRWVYFRKRASDGQFDIYSDIDSRLNYYRRVNKLLFPIMWFELFVGVRGVLYFIDYMNGESGATLLFNIISGALMIYIGVAIFGAWHSLRKKILILKKEKLLRE
ncbi:MAG: DUF2812 domain-containing protein [Holophagaceae bacterium]|nr:DUF2812 domain-containing protein [Holophagaceae bacterium]